MLQFLSDKFKGALALFGSAFIYASFGLLIREMAKMYGAYSQVAARFILAFIFILVLNRLCRNTTKVSRRNFFKAVILGCFFIIAVIFFTLSVTQTKIANSVFLLYVTSMIVSLIIGTLLFKEKFTTQKVFALVVALAGLFMYSNAIFALSTGIITGILSGVFDGLANALRKTLKGIDRAMVLQHQFLGGGLLAILVMLFMTEPIIKEITLWPILVTIIFALLQIKLGNWLLYGFQHFDVNIGTVILATEIFFASLIGFIFFKETLLLNEAIGGLLIFIASVISVVELKIKFRKVSVS